MVHTDAQCAYYNFNGNMVSVLVVQIEVYIRDLSKTNMSNLATTIMDGRSFSIEGGKYQADQNFVYPLSILVEYRILMIKV